MTSDITTAAPSDARAIPFHRIVPLLVRDPHAAVQEIGRQSDGEIVRLGLGAFRPYLVTRPAHVQHVLRDNAANYPREGMMWKPLRRLVGEISGEGEEWVFNRGIFQSLLVGPNIASVTDEMAATIVEAVAELGRRAAVTSSIDSSAEMVRIVHRAVIRVFFGDKISMRDADVLGPTIAKATASFGIRMLLPFVPPWFPLPGDRTLERAVGTVDEIMLPIVRETRRRGSEGNDLVSMLLRARDEHGDGLHDQQVRDGVVAMFVAGTETTATALTWLWTTLDAHPEVADRLYAEIDQVLRGEPPRRAHLPELRYTKMVLQELLRLYSVGWIIPRTAVADDVIDGVLIKRGATVIVSPYLTHRLASVWDRPDKFDPERFSPQRSKGRHKFAYLAFGAGPHQCVGRVFFTIEAQLIIAALVSRFRITLRDTPNVEPRLGLTLRPRERVGIALQPVARRPA
jgi:cytochrome P450